jgi:tRNA(Ile)-lysidine synthase
MRGIESDLDEELVEKYASDHNIKFYKKKLALTNIKSNFQAIARKERRQWLFEIALKFDYQKIATAHHLDDQVENFFIRLNRNSGLKGLKGMTPLSGIFIKPLLFTYREIINKYVETNNVPYREDLSNFSDKYDRNFIRNKMIPLMEDRYPEFSKNVIKSIDNINEAFDTIEDFSSLVEKNISKQKNHRTHISLDGLSQYVRPALILYYILSKYGLNRTQSDNLFLAQTGSIVQSEDLIFLKDRNFIIIENRGSRIIETPIIINENGVIKLSDHQKLKVSKVDHVGENLQNAIYIDAEKLKWPLTIRGRKQGDFFFPIGMEMKKKKLKKYLIDLKLNKFEKENTLLLTDQLDNIIWVIGYRQDDRYKVRPETQNISSIQIINYES